MRRYHRQHCKLRYEHCFLPDSSDESVADDSDEDSDYDPVDTRKKTFGAFFTKGRYYQI